METGQNPFAVFSQDSFEQLPNQSKSFRQEEPTKPQMQAQSRLKIKKRRIIHKEAQYGRGANHPSFFIRKFFSYIEDKTYSSIYKDDIDIFRELVEKINKSKSQKNRYNLQDLKQFFGEKSTETSNRCNYLNRKLLYQLISEKSVDLILQGSKCNQVLNHLISMEKYSGRLCHPNLVGRVEFQ